MTTFGKIRLGETLTFQRGYDITKAEQTPGDVPIVSSSGISSYHNVAKQSAPGVIIGRKGTLGTVHLVASRYWPHDTTLWVKDFKGNDPKFLYYFLQTLKLENFDTGSSNPTLNRNHLHKIEVWFPKDLSIQRKIAGVLSAYDDLIENNRRRIAILENMAEEIYREWFVRMRFPGHQNAKFKKGVPVGWEVKRIRDLISNYIGGGWGKEEQSGTFSEPAYVIRGTDIPKIQAGQFAQIPFRFHTASNLRSRNLREFDFVFEVSGGSKGQLLGRNLMVSKQLLEFLDKPTMCASFCKLMRFNLDIVSPYVMRFFMKLFHASGLAGLFQIQSTGLSNYQFESFLTHQTFFLSPRSLMNKFDAIAKPICNETDTLNFANVTLQRTRDALLTRLISGKLPVDELDIQLPPSMTDDASEEAGEESAHA